MCTVNKNDVHIHQLKLLYGIRTSITSLYTIHPKKIEMNNCFDVIVNIDKIQNMLYIVF